MSDIGLPSILHGIAPIGAAPSLPPSRGGVHGHLDTRVAHAQQQRRDLARRPPHEPELPLARGIGAEDGQREIRGPRATRVDHLSLVPVADELELLLPGESDAYEGPQRPRGLPRRRRQCDGLATRPRATRRVAMPGGGPARQRSGLLFRGGGPLPRDPLALADLPREAPAEFHSVRVAGPRAVGPAVQQPMSTSIAPIRAEGFPRGTRRFDRRVDGLLAVAVQHDSKALPARVSQRDSDGELAVAHGVHFLE
mmetsp:Transcript_82862/g.268490  ORF Transcript_82862/g.268490 Transcript_82862/m.268490 type:complete len:253 (-) Transcript_82862:2561-3319(-)